MTNHAAEAAEHLANGRNAAAAAAALVAIEKQLRIANIIATGGSLTDVVAVYQDGVDR